MKLIWFTGLSTVSIAPAAVANPVVDFVIPPAQASAIIPEPSLFALMVAGGVAVGVAQYIKRRTKK
jgi:hypothetical protein